MQRQEHPGGQVAIRQATERDVEELFRIRTSVMENHQSREELAGIGVTPGTVVEMLRSTASAWIAEVNGHPIGFSLADAARETVFALFVQPAFEKRGIGRMLLDRAEDWLWEQGCGRIWLLTGAEPHIRAHGFYRRQGWRLNGEVSRGQVKYVKERSAVDPSLS